ncbi:hypothetical protein Tco_0134893 [Tanacetum coccineum]
MNWGRGGRLEDDWYGRGCSLVSTFSQGDCFIPSNIKQSFSCLVNLLEVKQTFQSSVKETDNIQLGIVNQAELKLFSKTFFSFCTAAYTKVSIINFSKQNGAEGPGMIIRSRTLMTSEEDFLYSV